MGGSAQTLVLGPTEQEKVSIYNKSSTREIECHWWPPLTSDIQRDLCGCSTMLRECLTVKTRALIWVI